MCFYKFFISQMQSFFVRNNTWRETLLKRNALQGLLGKNVFHHSPRATNPNVEEKPDKKFYWEIDRGTY